MSRTGAAGTLDAMITVDRVTKRYGGFTAVDDVSFTAEQGRVTGFLGPNGAGKSTTMRIMVGLTPASHGSVTIGGLSYKDIPNPGRHVGVLLDASAQHSGRTGREVLVLGQSTMGLPPSRVDEMLELVSLTPKEAKRRVGNYSLGMRQRLGIAYALLGDPSILILDEPANGLDPAGIHWMRGLLREYAARGGTVLLSSHLLHEVEMIADDMVLIGQGRIVAHGSKEDLLETSGAFVRAVEPEVLLDVLAREGIVAHPQGDGLRTDAEPVQVGKVAAAAGLALVELRPAEGAGLEDLFLQLTADTQREGVVA
jgi:ABC-2 type transport system ATP-binding protein